MPTTDKTNFYVDVATGADTNGGSSIGAVQFTIADATAVVTAGVNYNITNNDSGGGVGWGSVDTDDWLCFDSGGVGDGPFWGIVTATPIADVANVDFTPSAGLTGDIINVAVRVGGAFATIDQAVGMIDNDWGNAAADPITIWVKNGAYPELATIANAGTALLPITLEGYSLIEGDGWDYDWTGNLPTMDGGDASDYGIRSSVATSNFWIIRHIMVKDSTGIGIVGSGSASDLLLEHLKSSGNAGGGIIADNDVYIAFCDISNNAGSFGIDMDNFCAVMSCDIYGNAGDGLSINTGSVISCMFWDNETENILCNSGRIVVAGNTIDGNYDGGRTSSVGISQIQAGDPISITAKNLIHNCNIALSGGTGPTALRSSLFNQWDNNNSANVNWIEGEGDVEDGAGAPGFTNEAGNNYQPTAVSPANGAAGPTTSPSGNTTTNRAVGAAEPSGGGGVIKLAGNGGGLVA